MLFGNPEDIVFGAYIRIGFFEKGRLKYQDEIHGPLNSQAHRATEMILNAVAHKYYPSNVAIQIKVTDDYITVMNEGFWSFDSLAVEDVYNGEHSSYPANLIQRTIRIPPIVAEKVKRML